jgi:6-phosphogluconolactonase
MRPAAGPEATDGDGAPVRVEVHDGLDALSAAAAARFAAAARAAVAARGRFAVALAGGQTPRALYALLAGAAGAAVPWPEVEVWFGDERCVPPDDAASNFRLAHETLLAHVAVPPAAVHRIRGELPAPAAADDYERALRAAFADGRTFDVVLLGVGGDGHTASLFPGAPTLDESRRWAVAAEAPPSAPVTARVSLTLPALAAAREAWLLCAGAETRDAVRAARRALADPAAPRGPAARVRARERTVWMLDRAAAGE